MVEFDVVIVNPPTLICSRRWRCVSMLHNSWYWCICDAIITMEYNFTVSKREQDERQANDAWEYILMSIDINNPISRFVLNNTVDIIYTIQNQIYMSIWSIFERGTSVFWMRRVLTPISRYHHHKRKHDSDNEEEERFHDDLTMWLMDHDEICCLIFYFLTLLLFVVCNKR